MLVGVDGIVVNLRDGNSLSDRLVHGRVGAIAAENGGYLKKKKIL